MARVLDIKHSTFIGTPKQLLGLFGMLRAQGASVVDAKFCNVVILDKPIGRAELREALESTPRTRRPGV